MDTPGGGVKLSTMPAVVRFSMVPLLVLSLGLHWALLQTTAWTAMVIGYSRHNSFTEAVGMTFDGQHPCHLCKIITQGRAEEKQQEQQAAKRGAKLDPGLAWEATDFIFSPPGELIPSVNLPASARREEPPKPRPRRVLPCHPA